MIYKQYFDCDPAHDYAPQPVSKKQRTKWLLYGVGLLISLTWLLQFRLNTNDYALVVEKFNSNTLVQPKTVSAHDISRENFTLWLEEQSRIAFEGILSNIGDPVLNSRSKEIAVGAVVASPSKHNPDYFYQWTRDAAITMNSVVTYLQDTSFTNRSLARVVLNYFNNSYTLQRLDNPSGTFKELKGLGEPKFLANSTVFSGHWGRPQNDGPALRVMTFFNFIKSVNKHGGFDELLGNLTTDYTNYIFHNEEDLYNQIIRHDLLFICENWHKESFDLWEEINLFHFFTSLVQLKALKMGLVLSIKYNDIKGHDRIHQEYTKLLGYILVDGGFRSKQNNFISETPLLESRGGLDTAVLIASLLTHDEVDPRDANQLRIPFNVDDSGILNTLQALTYSMQYLYPINHPRVNLNVGVGLGRYPEDVYNGVGTSEGNPWFLCTAAASELLFKLIVTYEQNNRDLVITESNAPLFSTFILDVTPKTLETHEIILPYHSPAYNTTMLNIFHFADSFLDTIREHVSNDGRMSEQFNKYTGYMEGARDLTWSYGSFYSSVRWRSKAYYLL